MDGDHITTLCTPVMVVDVDIVKRNAEKMRERWTKLGVTLRPHMKTHKTLSCIVVSTLAEASFYADHGYDDILYAYSVPFDKPISDMAKLSEVHPGNYVFFAVCDWFVQSGGRGCQGSEQGHRLLSMTQEHGRVEPLSGQLDYSQYPLGTLLTIIPYHACATAMMHPVYYIHSEGRLMGKWTPTRGW
ncbi:unnamed protein product, partial [Coregonus sp. 'balchen']